MSKKKSIRGRCYCSKVKFEIETPTKMFSHCHCESCRRTHGAAFVSWASVDDSQFHLQSGEELVQKYESSPQVIWMFCGNCGSPLFQTTRYSPGVTYICVAALEEPMDRPAEAHVSYEEKVPWLDIKDDLPKYLQKTSDIIRENKL